QSGTFGEGFKAGLLDFAHENDSIAQIGINLGQSLGRGISQTIGNFLGQEVTSLFDPTQRPDLQKSAAALAGSIVSAVGTQLIALGISKLLVGGLTDAAPQIAAAGATTAAATALGGAAGGLALAAGTTSIAAGEMIAASVPWSVIASELLAAAIAL